MQLFSKKYSANNVINRGRFINIVLQKKSVKFCQIGQITLVKKGMYFMTNGGKSMKLVALLLVY